MKKKQIITVLILAALLCSCGLTAQNDAAETSMQPISSTSAQPVEEAVQSDGSLYYNPVPYSKKGTGPAKPDTAPAEEYIYTYVPTESGTNHIVTLNDANVRDSVNAWIDEACSRALEKHDEYKSLVGRDSRYMELSEYDTPFYVSASCINGYLFLEVVTNCHMVDDSTPDLDYLVSYYYVETSSWDLYTGQKLEFTDLFYEGTDFISFYNKCVADEINLPQNITGFNAKIIPLKREFTGITEDCAQLAIDRVYFPKNNPYFQMSMSFNIDNRDLFFRDNSIIGQRREVENLFNDTENMYITAYKWINEYDKIKYSRDKAYKNIIMSTITRCDYLDDAKITALNDLAYRVAQSDEAQALAKKLFAADFDAPMYDEADGWFNGFLLDISVYKAENIVEIRIAPDMNEIGAAFYYDLDTLEKLDNYEVFSRVFGSDLEKASCSYGEEGDFINSEEFIAASTITGIYISDNRKYRCVNIAKLQYEFYCPISVTVEE